MGHKAISDNLIVGRYVSFPAQTSEAVQEAISYAVHKRLYVRVWYGDTQTGAVGCPRECIVEGILVRAPSLLGLPMIVPKSELTGPTLDVRRIVRIAAVVRQRNPAELQQMVGTPATALTARPLYSHPLFCPGNWKVTKRGARLFEVTWEGHHVRDFSTELAARRYASIMRGDVVTAGKEVKPRATVK